MPRGPKPDPKAIKLLKGSQKCRINAEEPAPLPPPKEPPVALDDDARAEWDRLFPILDQMRVLSASDLAALALYCSAWSQWQDAERQLGEMGLTIKTPYGLQVNPLVNVAVKARAQCLRFLAEFGCTPSSRTRVKGDPGKPRDEFAAFMSKSS